MSDSSKPLVHSPLAVIAGASGFIGRSLIGPLEEWGYRVRTIGRGASADTGWDDPKSIKAAIDGADLLINLAGRSVGCRYTDRNRQEIWDSRILTTRALHDAVSAASAPPRLWINASTATIYRHATDRPQTESTGEIGEGFSVDVATGWEREFFRGELPRTRRVAARMAIVLGDGAALNMLAMAARFGAGGPQLEGRWFGHRRYRGIGPTPTGPTVWHGHAPAHGRQRFSWIHIDDLVRAVRFIDTHPEITGPVNLSNPGVSDNATLMAALRRAVRMPIGIPAPRWLLETGMLVLRQESELVLKSRWVLPERLEAAGFDFRWTDVRAAVKSLLRR
ncbi:TIGR01777 family oxidoreductase [Brevibacterium ammoniilyticum]|uniref:TIGR01777 family oxidoreductase n=1 Tax=Brevibacterium ammoniilyticum TaxID=1046555 RepID=A0ABP9U891_9MICO